MQVPVAAKYAAKTALKRAPKTTNKIWRWYYLRYKYRGERPRDVESGEGPGREDVFSTIYNNNVWKNDESDSGFGSTLYNTTRIRRELPRLIRKHDIRTILDAPCGDFNWMSHVDIPENVTYIGCDIVPDLVDQLNDLHGKSGRTFQWLDIVNGPIPKADLWLCRDTLFHLSFDDGLRCLDNAAQSEVRYFLATSHDFVDVNRDIKTGEFRFIDLCKPPYSLPKPIFQFDDFMAPNVPRILGMWSREQLTEWFAQHRFACPKSTFRQDEDTNIAT